MTDSTQKRVSRFVAAQQFQEAIPDHLRDLASVVNDLANAYLEASDYGKRDFLPTDDWLENMGDAYYLLICLANQTHVDLERALDVVFNKRQQRLD